MLRIQPQLIFSFLQVFIMMHTALNIAFLAAAAPLLVAAAGPCDDFEDKCGADCSTPFSADCDTFMGTFTEDQIMTLTACTDSADAAFGPSPVSADLMDKVYACDEKRQNADVDAAANFIDAGHSDYCMDKIDFCPIPDDSECQTVFFRLKDSGYVDSTIKGQMTTHYQSCRSCTSDLEAVKSCTGSACNAVCKAANEGACKAFDAISEITESEKCKAAIDTSSVKLSNETQTVELDDKCEDKAEWLSCTSKTGICSDCVDVIDGSITFKKSTVPLTVNSTDLVDCAGCSATCADLAVDCKTKLADVWKQTEEASNAGSVTVGVAVFCSMAAAMFL